MNLSRIFILRPVATSLLMIAIMLVGIVAYRQLPVSALPEVDYPTILIQTFYPGASPEVMASSVTAPLERQFGQVPGLTQMTSTSSQGSSLITLQFSLDLNIDVAEQEVQQSINSGATYLPADLPNPPIYSKSNPADTPILTLALSSTALPLTKVEDLADTRLAQKISQLPGVGLVSISGGQRPAVRIQVNPTQLSAYGQSLENVRAQLAAANVNQAKGNFDGPHQSYTVGANDQLLSSIEYKPLVITYQNGAPITLSDVANVTDGAENVKEAAWMNQTPAIILNIQRQPGANIISVVDSVKKLLPTLKASLPSSINIDILTDRTNTIRASVADVEFELCLTVLLVVLVIFVFLRNVAATIIPSVAVPLSLVGTFGVMYLLGYSLNNLTLMALTISTGFVVDDAIVMIENIVRYIEDGEAPLAAALKGSAQIGFTILSLSVSLIAVLIPLLFMGDIVGRLFREFAVTLSVTIVVSAIVSLTLTPMMCAKLLRHKLESQQSRLYHWSESVFNWIIDAYARSLDVVLKHQTITLMIAIATLALTIWLYVLLPKGFFPVQDTGVILGISEAAQTISFEGMADRQQALARAINADPDVESLSSFIGIDGTNTTLNSGRIQINLKPLREIDMGFENLGHLITFDGKFQLYEGTRTDSASDVIRRLEQSLEQVEGITLYMQPVQDLTVEDRVSRTQYQYTMEDADATELATWVPQMVEKIKEIKQLRDVATDQQNGGLQAMLVIDRDTASRLGITPSQIDNTLYDAFGQRQVSTIYTQLNQYHVVLEVNPKFQTKPFDLSTIYVSSGANGQTPAGGSGPTAPSSGQVATVNTGQVAAASTAQVPLAAFTHLEQVPEPLAINHQGQFPVTTISFNLAPGASLGDAVSQINDIKDQLGLPASIQAQFQGTAAAFEASLTNEPLLILAALVTVYIVLGVLYESYIHPITILSTLPSAAVGAFLALEICKNDFSVIALIGIILLIGIVKKNAIMMIDFALDAQREQGKPPVEAIYQACLLRLRPILMTTMAALLAGVPLAMGSGTGSELRRPLGITMIGGLIFSQMLTLYTTPVIYLWFDRLGKQIGVIREKRPEVAEPGDGGALAPA